MPHFMFSTVALFANLYRCCPMVVGDGSSDPVLMRELGARVTTEYPTSYSPATYVVFSTPRLLMDKLETMGYALHSSFSLQDHITWVMIKKTETAEGEPKQEKIQKSRKSQTSEAKVPLRSSQTEAPKKMSRDQDKSETERKSVALHLSPEESEISSQPSSDTSDVGHNIEISVSDGRLQPKIETLYLEPRPSGEQRQSVKTYRIESEVSTGERIKSVGLDNIEVVVEKRKTFQSEKSETSTGQTRTSQEEESESSGEEHTRDSEGGGSQSTGARTRSSRLESSEVPTEERRLSTQFPTGKQGRTEEGPSEGSMRSSKMSPTERRKSLQDERRLSSSERPKRSPDKNRISPGDQRPSSLEKRQISPGGKKSSQESQKTSPKKSKIAELRDVYYQ